VISEPETCEEEQERGANRPRLFGILTAFKENMFTLKQTNHIDFYHAGEVYFAPSEFSRTNKGVLLMLQHNASN